MRGNGRTVFITGILILAALEGGLYGEGRFDREKGRGEKVYVIATDTSFAPFEFQDSRGKYHGIDVDLLAGIARDQGFAYELQPLGFITALEALEAGEVDGVIAGMSITPERKQKYQFSAPYYDSGVVLAVDAGNKDIIGYEDLRGCLVAVKTGTEGAAFAESLRDWYGFDLVYFEESSFMYEDVKLGDSTACFEDYLVMAYSIAQGNGLRMVGDVEKGSSYGFAVYRGRNQELLDMFNAGLRNLQANGTYRQILRTYIPRN